MLLHREGTPHQNAFVERSTALRDEKLNGEGFTSLLDAGDEDATPVRQ
jgi:hypothetical protein